MIYVCKSVDSYLSRRDQVKRIVGHKFNTQKYLKKYFDMGSDVLSQSEETLAQLIFIE